MYEFNGIHRGVFIGLAALLLGGVGYTAREMTLPPVALTQQNTGSPGGESIPTQKMRSGGASPKEMSEDGLIVVHVAGAVKKPGVIALPADKRVVDAIHRAGGPSRDADLNALNLASRMADGQQILVPRKGDSAGREAKPGVGSTPGGMIAVNTATEEELDALPGVGPATAQKIVEHRTINGPFNSPEELLDVSGIGPKKLERMKPYLQIP